MTGVSHTSKFVLLPPLRNIAVYKTVVAIQMMRLGLLFVISSLFCFVLGVVLVPAIWESGLNSLSTLLSVPTPIKS